MNRSSCVNESIFNLPMEDDNNDNVLDFLERARHMQSSFLIEDQTSLSALSLGKMECTSDPFSEMDLDDLCSTIRDETLVVPRHVDNQGHEAHQAATDGRRRRVHFSTAEFRHYALVVGSHDNVEAAMELDWKFNPEITVRNLRSEHQREQYKPRKLSYQERRERLEEVSGIRVLAGSQQQSLSLKGLPKHSDALVDMVDFSSVLATY